MSNIIDNLTKFHQKIFEEINLAEPHIRMVAGSSLKAKYTCEALPRQQSKAINKDHICIVWTRKMYVPQS